MWMMFAVHMQMPSRHWHTRARFVVRLQRERAMPEQLRTFFVQQQQRAQQRVYEGRPSTPWAYRGQSLPPAPDVPQSQRETTGISGRAKPRSAGEMAFMRVRVHKLSEQGLTGPQIADALGCALGYVHRLRSLNKRHGVPVVVKEPNLLAPTPTPVMVALPAPAGTCVSAIAGAARFSFEVPAMPPMITRTATTSTASRSGTHVLDWQQKFARIEFADDDNSAGARKTKGKRRKSPARKVSTKSDFRDAYPVPHMSQPSVLNPVVRTRVHACAIDCAAPGTDDQRARAERANKARKEAELAIFSAG